MRLTTIRGDRGPRSASNDLTRPPAPYAASLTLTVTVAGAVFLLVMPAVLLVVHPLRLAGAGAFGSVINQQSQNAKTALYVVAFLVVLPVSVVAVPRLADRIASIRGPSATQWLSAALGTALVAMLVLVRLSGPLPWGDGLGTLLAGTGAWWILATAVLLRAGSVGAGPSLPASVTRRSGELAAIGGALLIALLLCVTSLRSLSPVALAFGAIVAAAVLAGSRRPLSRRPLSTRLDGPAGRALDGVAVAVLLFAAVDVVVFRSSGGLPNIYFPPGVIQYQQDWILGPTNQLLSGGGAVLVNVPSSQYGVGLVYFLAAWFHLVPIGYGTFGLLDGLLTGVVYVTAYCVLRIAGVGRLLACAAMALAVTVLLYNLPYSVGALPEEGPLRFGLPMAVILAKVAGDHWPRHVGAARLVAVATLAVSSIWAIEAFAYTAFTFAAMTAAQAWLSVSRPRRRWIGQQAAIAVGGIIAAHLLLAAATLASTSRLPDWGQYLGYLHALLLGGREGTVTYGFSRWSPGLVVGAADFISAAAVLLLLRRVPAIARRRPTLLLALAGTTAYAIACFSYNDNRSSSYLLLYTSLPLLMTGTLWLALLLGAPHVVSRRWRGSSLAFALAVSLLMLAAAWPSVGPHFSRTALAHAYPGGGLTAALRRLRNPPAIDPRAPEGERLLQRYIPRGRPIIVLPADPDLGVEIALRARRASPLFIGDPTQDVFVPSTWTAKLTREIAALRPGRRVLFDETALRDVRRLRRRPAGYVLDHPLTGSNAQLDWVAHQLDLRFRLVPVHRAGDAYVIVSLAARR